MKVTDEDNEIKAFAEIIFNESIKINGIKVIVNDVGKLIVVLPENKIEQIQYVVPLSVQLRKDINNEIINKYFSIKESIKNAKTTSVQKGIDQNG